MTTAIAPTCTTCTHAHTESKNVKLTRWMRERGLAVCQKYAKREKRPLLIPLINAAGAVCGGRWYSPMLITEEVAA